LIKVSYQVLRKFDEPTLTGTLGLLDDAMGEFGASIKKRQKMEESFRKFDFSA
jgi:hypothetical protein